MKPLIKIDLNKIVTESQPVVLDIGCGKNKRPGAIGIDRIDLPGVDIVADIEDGLKYLPDKFADEIYALQCLEHLENFESVLGEIVRVLKKDGRATVEVPHFSNPYFYSDPTHRRFFGLYSFYYFVENKYQIGRKVPDYYFPFKIKVISRKIIFESPFLLGKIVKPLLQVIFNLGTLMQEFYEENLCYLFPCNSVRVVFTGAEETAG